MAVVDPVRPGIYMRYENVGSSAPITTPTRESGGSTAPVNLEEAIATAASGSTITLRSNTAVTSPLCIPDGKIITLNVPAGVTLSLDAGSSNYGMVVKGEVVIEGDGNIVLTGFGFGTSMNTDSKLTIKSGHFIAKGCDYIIGCFDGEVVIEGGVFEGEYCVVNNFSDYYKTDGKLTITGGTFATSNPEGFDVLGGPVAISGGRFSKPVDEAHCAEGYAPVVNEDGSYSVE